MILHDTTKANVISKHCLMLGCGWCQGQVKSGGKRSDGLEPVETPTSQPQSNQCRSLSTILVCYKLVAYSERVSFLEEILSKCHECTFEKGTDQRLLSNKLGDDSLPRGTIQARTWDGLKTGCGS